jgi:glycosyltransferase involved in cell wall biosynthesis
MTSPATASGLMPLRVLHVTMRLGQGGGGIASAIVTNVVAERRQAIEPTVAFAAAADEADSVAPTIQLLRTAGAAVECFPRAGRPARAAGQFGLSRTANRWLTDNVSRYDVVHAQGVWGAINCWALLVARRVGVPTVLTPHESLTEHDRLTSQSPLRAAAKAVSARAVPYLADYVIYTSADEKATSAVTGRKGDAIVWHAVVDELRPRPAAALRTRDADDIVVGVLGRLDPKKNIPLLIHAIALDPRLSLVVAGSGDGEIESALRRTVSRLGLDGRVSFLGHITPAARARFFATIDVLAMPSNFENFGLAAAEALEYGVPVVVSKRTGVAAVVNARGLGAVVPVDPAALAQALATWGRRARDPALARLIQSAARDELSFRRYGEAILEVYRLAARPSTRDRAVTADPAAA